MRDDSQRTGNERDAHRGAPIGGNTAFHLRRQAQEALALATRRTGKLGGWSAEARDPNVLRRNLEGLARNALVAADLLERVS